MNKINYTYNAITGEYIEQVMARESPRESGVYLTPQYATVVAPPATIAHEVAVFVGGTWTVKPDWRGEVFYDQQTGTPIRIDVIGALPDPSWVDSPAPSKFHTWNGMSWVLDLNLARAAVIAEIEVAAEESAARYITSTPSQVARYMLKIEEARAHKAAGYPADLTGFPMIAAEHKALSAVSPTATAQQASSFIINTEYGWRIKAAQIERARRTGKELAKVSTTATALYAARDAAVAALRAL